MEHDPVEQLRANRREYARLYRDLVEALMQEGVPEHQARASATDAAIQAIMLRESLREPWDE